MSALFWLLAFSLLAQLITCVLAFRLNWVHGWKWPWILISLGLCMMTVRRAIMLCFAWQVESLTLESLTFDGASLQLATAITSLVASMCLLAGVGLIGALFEQLAHAENLLLVQNQQLECDVKTAEDQFATAREIQQLLYPRKPPEIPGYDIAGQSIPALAAGGDYFDFIPMGQDSWGIAVGDVSGHGLGPALTMAQIHASVRTLAQHTNDPCEILRSINRLLLTQEATGRFVTLFFARLDVMQNQMEFASAAHPAYVIRDSGEVVNLLPGSMPLGLVAEWEIPPATVMPLAANEMLLIPTDGITEAFSETGEMHGVERLLSVIHSQKGQAAELMIQKIQTSLKAFTAEDHMQDDVTLVIVKRLEEQAVLVA